MCAGFINLTLHRHSKLKHCCRGVSDIVSVLAPLVCFRSTSVPQKKGTIKLRNELFLHSYNLIIRLSVRGLFVVMQPGVSLGVVDDGKNAIKLCNLWPASYESSGNKMRI